jgi:hypothetical protein
MSQGNRIPGIVLTVWGHAMIQTSSSDRTHSRRFSLSSTHSKTKSGPVSEKVVWWTISKFQSRLPIYKPYLSPGNFLACLKKIVVVKYKTRVIIWVPILSQHSWEFLNPFQAVPCRMTYFILPVMWTRYVGRNVVHPLWVTLISDVAGEWPKTFPR